ncbi:MAG: hypothetical protein FJW39_30835 [Acidobacteria bacterium]|nr:hypothetical protein [Acidobacteriota bacterium]
MKLLVLMMLAAAMTFGQTKKSYWLIKIEPAREGFIQSMTVEEKKVMGEHFEYLKGKLKEGKLVLAGPGMDREKPLGIILVEVPTREEAEQIAQNDPSVKAGVQLAKVYQFHMSLARDGIR